MVYIRWEAGHIKDLRPSQNLRAQTNIVVHNFFYLPHNGGAPGGFPFQFLLKREVMQVNDKHAPVLLVLVRVDGINRLQGI